MCGILGQVNKKLPVKKELFHLMLKTLHHRGPDDSGTLFSNDMRIAFGHTRLSFLDLSTAGKQPLSNTNKTVWVTFNGEIYNYLELKEQLKGEYDFVTKTDTEVLLAAYQKWGIEFIGKLKGMFSFALLDTTHQKVFIARDRFGIKPLYYFSNEESFLFASELKAIITSGIPPKEINYNAFSDYFVYRYIPSPGTIWKNVSKLPPAHYLELNLYDLTLDIREYWTLEAGNYYQNECKLVSETDEILLNSIREHIRADVKVGSFLSGGYDSSALVYYMKKRLNYQPETFSIGFDKWESSEHFPAKLVADYLNVKNEAVIADQSSLDLVQQMSDVYDEPIADISIVPTFMVSRLARARVKAVLSGEGADEIFGGYTWQKDFYAMHNPAGLYNKIKVKLSTINTVDFYANAMAMGLFDATELRKMLQPELHQYISKDVYWFYRKHYKKEFTPLKSIQYLDIKCFMAELVLTKVDRASMANSLEVRVPFLDHELCEKVFQLKESCYFKKNTTKHLLYKNLKDHLPKAVLNRKKQGFVGPDSYYMQNDWYRKELTNSKLVEHNIVRQSYIDNLLNETYNWKLWKLLIMEKWFAKWMCD